MTMWTEVAKFQTLIVGILGFAGVIYTLRHNGKVAREQRRDERCDEREALRTALIEELKINRQSLNRNLESIEERLSKKTGGVFVPTDPMDDAYQSFVARVGLLSQAEVSKVMYAYLSLQTYTANLFLYGVPAHTTDRQVQIPAKNIPALTGMQEQLIGPIDEAIEVMERARAAAP